MNNKHVRLNLKDVPWEPWDRYFPGAPPNPEHGEYGGWCKPLRLPEGDDQHHTFLLRIVPPKGKRFLFSAVAGGNEEGYVIEGSALDVGGKRTLSKGSYIYHSAGALHSGYLDAEHIVYVHYDGGPDEIRKLEIVD